VTYPSHEGSQERIVPGAKKKRWGLWLGLGCLGMFGLAVIGVVGIAMVVLGTIKQSWAYEQALSAAKESPGVRQALGEPIVAGWRVTGNVNVSGASGDADLSFPISGPLGKGTIYAEGRKQAGEWDLHLLVVDPAGGERIDLLEELEGSSIETVESFLAAAGRGDYEAAHDHFAGPLEEVQPYDVFAGIAADNTGFFQVQELRLVKSQGENGPHYEGTLLLESGPEVSASFDLVREAGKWRLMAYHIGS